MEKQNDELLISYQTQITSKLTFVMVLFDSDSFNSEVINTCSGFLQMSKDSAVAFLNNDLLSNAMEKYEFPKFLS